MYILIATGVFCILLCSYTLSWGSVHLGEPQASNFNFYRDMSSPSFNCNGHGHRAIAKFLEKKVLYWNWKLDCHDTTSISVYVCWTRWPFRFRVMICYQLTIAPASLCYVWRHCVYWNLLFFYACDDLKYFLLGHTGTTKSLEINLLRKYQGKYTHLHTHTYQGTHSNSLVYVRKLCSTHLVYS